MPITGRTLHEAARRFTEHINNILARTVTRSRVIAVSIQGVPRVQLTFRQGGHATSAPLHTRYGRMELYFGQVCESVPRDDGLHRLQTVKYTYTLTPSDDPQPLLRWEYVRAPETGAHWCRHHLQGPVPLRINARHSTVLNDLHLPTGYVPFEEILRFCIVDLGVDPLSDEWHNTLTESYDQFKAEFTQ